MLLHVLGHVDADHRVLVVEEELGERPRGLGLPDAGGAEEDERADGPVRILEAGARAAHRGRDGLHRLLLADDALGELLLHREELLDLALHELRDRDAGPLRDHLGDLLGRHLLAEHRPAGFCSSASFSWSSPTLRCSSGSRPNLISAAFWKFGLALGLGLLLLQRVDLLVRLRDLLDDRLLRVPAALQARELLVEVRELLLHLREPVARRLVLLLLEPLPLDLELRDPAAHLVDLGGHRVDLDAQPARRLVDEVDRLVGEEAVRDVAVGEPRRLDERRVLDAHLVVHLVALLQAAQDRDRVRDGRLAHEHRLEAPLERGVLLDVLAVLVHRGRADRVQLAAGERRLEHVARVHRALGGAGADDGVHLVDEQDDLALGGDDLLQHGLQPLLELAAVLRAGDHRAEVEREEPLALQPLGDVAVHDAPREPLHDGGLSDARVADEHRVVLRAAGEDLDDAADLVVAADHRVELAGARELREVLRVLLERAVLALRLRGGDARAAADVLQRGADPVRLSPRRRGAPRPRRSSPRRRRAGGARSRRTRP